MLATLGAACSLLPEQRDQPRAEQLERAVLPMARAALNAGQTETARRLYRRLLQIDPGSVDARMGLGDAAVESREPAVRRRSGTWRRWRTLVVPKRVTRRSSRTAARPCPRASSNRRARASHG